MNRLVRAIAHALQRLAALLLGLAGNEDVDSHRRPVRADGSPPPDWLRRMRRDPPRDWLERIRRGRPRWVGGSTPAAPAWPAPLVGLDAPTLPSPGGGGKIAEAAEPTFGAPTLPSPGGGGKGAEAGGGEPISPSIFLGREIGERAASRGDERATGRLSAASPSSADAADERAVVAQAPDALGSRAHPAPKKHNRHGRWFEGIRRARDGGPMAEVAPPLPGRSEGQPLDDLFGSAWPRMSVVPPSGAGDLPRQAFYEIEELPFEADADDPWPDLLADPPGDGGDPATIWRGWERRERLAREQRGD